MRILVGAVVSLLLLGACSSSAAHKSASPTTTIAPATADAPTSTTVHRAPVPPSRPGDVYAHDRPNEMSPVVKGFRPLVYVPNSLSNTVDVINPATYQVVSHFAVGRLPQHVVPAWDLKTLYVTNDLGNSLTPIDPKTGAPGPIIPVEDPYNMYFTPDGAHAIVVAERLGRLDFRDPHSFKLQQSVRVGCTGVDHMDFSADGRFLVASCEFSGQLIKVDVQTMTLVGTIPLHGGNSKPQDVKLGPAGNIFYVADMTRGGVYTVDADTFTVTSFIPTGTGAHGLYVSRDSKTLFVTNRGGGSISLIDFATKQVRATWSMPGGGSPDMGGVSADGTKLWISGRYNGQVYVFDIATGTLLRRIGVGSGPHGLCVYPQPGRYSLGHTGVFR